MKIAFLTEMGFSGKISEDHRNMRTEFAWMHALNANHYNIRLFESVQNYDHIFIIFPKGEVYLNSIGVKLVNNTNPISDILVSNLVTKLKSKNKKVHFVQEGPHWLWNDYKIYDQIHFYNLIQECDSIFAHNEHDTQYYKGLFPNKKINTIQTLMIEKNLSSIIPTKQDICIIGGNFARWYGGFESYIVASKFSIPIYVQDSHAKREAEELMDGLNHLPRMEWLDWMKNLSKFKYAVHLMPTIAAGTFSLNCAYFGIPCIGNREVDTQKICHPSLSVDVNDINKAIELATTLKDNKSFYEECSYIARNNYNKYYSIEVWKNNIIQKLYTL
jgi:hypothetical protein